MTFGIDLSKLPAPQVVETLSYEAILAERKASLLSLLDADQRDTVEATLALESEPLTKLLQESAYREMVLRNRVNDAARAVMLAFSKGSDLDQMAARYSVTRLVITPQDNSTVPPTPAVMESDASLLDRTMQAFEGLSVAGPRGAYNFHARSADGRVADASTISPDPCDVVVTVLAQDGDGEAPADLLDKVRAALNDEDIRPVGDRLTVQSASIIHYSIELTVYLDKGPEAEPVIEAARARVDAYRNTQRRLGRDVNRSAIIAAAHVEGVKKVVLDSPADDIAIDPTQAAYCTDVTIVNGGTGD